MSHPLRFFPLALVLTACGGDPGEGPNGIARLTSGLERRDPDLPPADLSQLVRDNAAFALDLYHELAREEPSESFFYSPYSISTAMAMAYVGARAETKEAIASTLHFALPDDTLHQGFNALDRTIQSRERAATESRPGVSLRTTNDIWASEVLSERPSPEYVDALALDYRAEVNLVSFGDEAASRATINGEISRQTEGRIEELIAPGIIQPGVTTMILTNTIYFKAGWAAPFLTSNTQPATFHNLGGGQGTVEMMDAVNDFDYAETDSLQAVRLPYVGGETALLVVLPKADFVEVESGLDLTQLNAVRTELQSTSVHVRLPAFTMRSALELKETLQSLGMYAGFEDSRSYDFSGIGPGIEFISDVLHEAFITVNEVGTEAGAATAVVFGRESAGPQAEVEVILDRPFIVVLEDIPTGAVLFAGRYVKAP